MRSSRCFEVHVSAEGGSAPLCPTLNPYLPIKGVMGCKSGTLDRPTTGDPTNRMLPSPPCIHRGSTPRTPYASALTSSSARVASVECLRTFPSTASRYPHVTDRPGEQVTSRRWRNATAICPPELRNVRTCSCIMLRAAHTSALPHTHTLTHAALARALRSVADPERSLLDGSPSGRLQGLKCTPRLFTADALRVRTHKLECTRCLYKSACGLSRPRRQGART